MTADLADDLPVGHGPGVRAMIRLIAEQVGGVCVAVDMTREGRPRADRVQSVDRAVELLRAVAVASGSDSGAAALAQMCGLNRATAWRLLMTLEEQGMVARNPHNGWFTLGPTFLELRAFRGSRRPGRGRPVRCSSGSAWRPARPPAWG
jgi:hypothetical protein